MSTIPVPFQLTQIPHQSCSQRIEVQIAYEFEKVCVFFTDDGLVSVLKQVPAAPMATVEGPRISRQERSHATRKRSSVSTNQEMKMVRDEYPGIDRQRSVLD